MLKPTPRTQSNTTTPGALLGVMAFALVTLVAATPITGLKLTGDANANGYSLTNADNIEATNGYFNSVTATNGITGPVQWSSVTNTPTTVAGYGITDALSLSSISGTNGITAAISGSNVILSGSGGGGGGGGVYNSSGSLGLTLTTSAQPTGCTVTLPQSGYWMIQATLGLGLGGYSYGDINGVLAQVNANGTDIGFAQVVSEIPGPETGSSGYVDLIIGPLVYNGTAGDVVDLDLWLQGAPTGGSVGMYNYTVTAIFLHP